LERRGLHPGVGYLAWRIAFFHLAARKADETWPCPQRDRIIRVMKAPLPERRVQRSSNPQEALACWLEATRRRTNLRSLALADELGILVAGAGPARECDELAAWAGVLREGGADWPERPPFELSAAKVPGFDAYVCLEGADEALNDVALDAAAGCSRILCGRA
jgi:hypothetical protein